MDCHLHIVYGSFPFTPTVRISGQFEELVAADEQKIVEYFEFLRFVTIKRCVGNSFQETCARAALASESERWEAFLRMNGKWTGA